MKNRKCPMHKHCWDYKDNNCDNCNIDKCISGLHNKIDRLKAENAKLKTENEKVRDMLEECDICNIIYPKK